MAWSDAARRAALLARRLKRVGRFEPKTSKQQTQKDYLMAGMKQRLAKWRARTTVEVSSLKDRRGVVSVKTRSGERFEVHARDTGGVMPRVGSILYRKRGS